MGEQYSTYCSPPIFQIEGYRESEEYSAAVVVQTPPQWSPLDEVNYHKTWHSILDTRVVLSSNKMIYF